MFIKTCSGWYVNTDYVRLLKLRTDSNGEVVIVAEFEQDGIRVAECQSRDDAEIAIKYLAKMINGE